MITIIIKDFKMDKNMIQKIDYQLKCQKIRNKEMNQLICKIKKFQLKMKI